MNVENIAECELSLEDLDAVAGGFLGIHIHINFKKIFHDVANDVGKAVGAAVNWVEHHPTQVIGIAASIIAEA
jgi:hypothetical protein